MTPVELIAAVLSVVAVWLMVKQNVWGWPLGAVAVVLYFYVFAESKLYASAGLQGVFFLLQLYGWWHWLRGSEGQSLPVRRTPLPLLLGVLAAGTVGAVGLSHGLSTFTDAMWVYLDSTVTAFSLVAQWMLARKLLENWLFWIAVDGLYLVLCAGTGMWPTLVLYAIFLLMAILGYREWMKSYREAKPA
jgi:nicotinamide mononucleotide transporter